MIASMPGAIPFFASDDAGYITGQALSAPAASR